MTTFTSRYDSDGTGKFMVGDISRVVIMGAIDFHAVAQLLNEAYKVGAQDATKRMAAVVNGWANGEGV